MLFVHKHSWEIFLSALISKLILWPGWNRGAAIQEPIKASSKYIFKNEQYLLHLENGVPLFSLMPPNTHFWNFLINIFLIHIYRLMTHLITVQSKFFLLGPLPLRDAAGKGKHKWAFCAGSFPAFITSHLSDRWETPEGVEIKLKHFLNPCRGAYVRGTTAKFSTGWTQFLPSATTPFQVKTATQD